MTELDKIANLAEIFGAIMVIGGVIFAVIQINLFRQQRRDKVAIELLRSFQGPEFTRAFRLVQALDDGVSAAELRACNPGCEDAAMIIGTTIECVGLMVFRRIVSLKMVSELMGGTVLVFWRKLDTWIHELRVEQSRDDAFEWFQWLTERLEEYPDPKREQGAYIRYRDWKPKE